MVRYKTGKVKQGRVVLNGFFFFFYFYLNRELK